MPDIPPDSVAPTSLGSTAAHAVIGGRHRARKARHLRETLTLASITIALLWSIAGCTSHRSPNGEARTGTPTQRSSLARPSPTDTVVVKTIPSIVPFVDEALQKLDVAVPLQADEEHECHLNRPSHYIDGQLCRWFPDNAESGRYRLLSVHIFLWGNSAEAEQSLENSIKLMRMAPKSVVLGSEAMAGAAQAPDKSVAIRGHDQSLSLSGADLAVRVHNVSIDITWLGADYTVKADGTPTHVNGLAPQQAIQQSITIAKAIIAHIK